jgi:hypothetical protein
MPGLALPLACARADEGPTRSTKAKLIIVTMLHVRFIARPLFRVPRIPGRCPTPTSYAHRGGADASVRLILWDRCDPLCKPATTRH